MRRYFLGIVIAVVYVAYSVVLRGQHSEPMVAAMRETLSGLGIPKHQIKVDYFSGYA